MISLLNPPYLTHREPLGQGNTPAAPMRGLIFCELKRHRLSRLQFRGSSTHRESNSGQACNILSFSKSKNLFGREKFWAHTPNPGKNMCTTLINSILSFTLVCRHSRFFHKLPRTDIPILGVDWGKKQYSQSAVLLKENDFSRLVIHGVICAFRFDVCSGGYKRNYRGLNNRYNLHEE